MSKIYHILSREDWKKAKIKGSYAPASLKNDGFIHFSHADQLLSVANSFFRGQKDLIILKVAPKQLLSPLKIEPPLEAPMSGVLFPHLYGELNLDAVKGKVDFPCEEDGSFLLPEDLTEA